MHHEPQQEQERERLIKIVRDKDHFKKVVHYTEWNPVKAGIVRAPEECRFSSANPNRQWESRDCHARYLGAHLIHPKWEKSGARSWSYALPCFVVIGVTFVQL
jgi:hypothetical protein